MINQEELQQPSDLHFAHHIWEPCNLPYPLLPPRTGFVSAHWLTHVVHYKSDSGQKQRSKCIWGQKVRCTNLCGYIYILGCLPGVRLFSLSGGATCLCMLCLSVKILSLYTKTKCVHNCKDTCTFHRHI